MSEFLNENSDEEPPLKRIKLSSEIVFSSDLNFHCLPEDVLLEVFSYINHVDLMSVSKTCSRLNRICADKTLWRIVNIQLCDKRSPPLIEFIDNFHPNTKYLTLKGLFFPEADEPNYECLITKSFFYTLREKSPNLICLILDNHVIDSEEVTLEEFPPCLEYLAIRNCCMKNLNNSKSYFYRLEKTLTKLKKLDISNNSWFVPHSLLALSKCETLENLVLTGCDVSDCLPYASLAANFGFTALKVLDLRKTLVGDIELTCFNRTSTLRHLYLCAVEVDARDMELQVTDNSIITFGGSNKGGERPLNMEDGIIIIKFGAAPRPVCNLETLVLENYSGITDLTLRHAAVSMCNLKYLDITGTGCSEDGIEQFTKIRPDCKVIPYKKERTKSS